MLITQHRRKRNFTNHLYWFAKIALRSMNVEIRLPDIQYTALGDVQTVYQQLTSSRRQIFR